MALSAERDTKEKRGLILSFPMSAAAVCWAGGIAVLNGGFAEAATTATGLVCVGRIEESMDNTNGADGDLSVLIRQGVFKFKNSAAADLIAQDDAGKIIYLVDDETVALTNGTNTRSAAGIVVAVDDDGVWVKMGLGVV